MMEELKQMAWGIFCLGVVTCAVSVVHMIYSVSTSEEVVNVDCGINKIAAEHEGVIYCFDEPAQ